MGVKNLKQLHESKMQYSQQAYDYLKLLPDFDLSEFEEWYKSNMVIGGGHIMQYLTSKHGS